ncbi:phosophoadenylyl-sulfate reductase [Propionibacterium sp. oral taxon 192 str. F0372]|uniref:phosphoadenylyl-sulfate reductase n=1 Tax=Propionibacterium sp. oral taxon 192 TaxID=671222 RepID=UPI00035305C8|nr:phosphoadenylyl-sulfate reductase [Propionibacterium sp. oral taxon 192]EPH07079.1 phosophoadenylyl-sulfate reductase [Propionibacterium sp. oral taxon 192 str. F0372]
MSIEPLTHGPGRVRGPEELRRIAEWGAGQLAGATAQQVVRWAAETFGRNLVIACSMAADTIVPHLFAQRIPGVDVLFLQTGFHFAETLGTRDALAHSLDITLVEALPRLTVDEQEATWGPRLFEHDPAKCCMIRKVEPINRELGSYEAWVTGLKRVDNPLRAHSGLVEWDEAHQMVKINPIVAWTDEQVREYADRHSIPVNWLLDEGYPSIGCEPCTRPVAPGEDPRSGRWAGHAKTECGLHQLPGVEETR